MKVFRMIDSGIVVVISIIFAMVFIVLYVLLTVKYEWCPVLFPNSTVSFISVWLQ